MLLLAESGSPSLTPRRRVTLWESGGEFRSSVTQPTGWTDKGLGWTEVLQEVFRDGKLVNEITFAEVRANSNK